LLLRQKSYGFDLDISHVVRALVINATGQSRFKTVSNLSLKKLQESWDKAQPGINYALLSFLKNNTMIENITQLSSPFLILPIAVLSILRDEKISAEEEKALVKWIYTAHAFGHFSRGSSESILDADLNILLKKMGLLMILSKHLKGNSGG
jgi:hypothetical protein